MLYRAFHTARNWLRSMNLAIWIGGTKFFNYKFNFSKAGRFVEAYLMGYINGLDTNDDTPMLSGGACTKIE